LIADLTDALEPDSPQSLLAVFDLVGRSAYRRLFGSQASDGLTGAFAEALVLVIRRVDARYYTLGKTSSAH